ncbi:hypothetical protein HYQ45_016500 [Verticillium longisporum]|uniref:MGS207 protein n=1 Tax=Verticillium longisporum TaxID=100787 RepID=A0A8I2Z5T5_VERLO|nr:hypothetical protein HYQ45_016500 [Verticillium longisporum]
MSFLAHVPLLGRLVAGADDAPQAIDLPPVEVHNVETDPEKRARCLKHLIKANHVNHAIVYHHLQFDNHAAHILCSAYLLGASENQLHSMYETVSRELEPWQDSPAEVIEEDWQDFLGDKRYQRAYVDFFEDGLALQFNYDWKTLMAHYLLKGDQPLMNAKEIAIEALALSCVQYNYLHKYLDEQKYTRPAPFSSTSPVDILHRMAGDARFDGLFATPGFDNVDLLFGKHEDLVLEYWNAWAVADDDNEDPVRQLQKSQEAAVALLVATMKPGTHAYNFFTVHLLTTSHAVRILLPVLPARFHVALVRAWWLLTVAVYAAMGRPRIDEDYVQPVPQGRGWAHVEHEALHSRHASDAHYVKAIRAMKEAARTWGDVHERYLAAAVTFVDGFEGWVFD